MTTDDPRPRPMMTRRALLPLLAVLTASACAPAAAGGPSRRDLLLTDEPRPANRACRVSAYPRELPAASALVDSAALVRDAEEAWRAAGAPAAHVLFALRFDREGINVRREVMEHTVPRPLADSLQALAFAHRRTVGEADREWSARLRMDLGGQPRLRVGRSELCAPAVRNRDGTYSTSTGRAWGDVRDAAPAPTAADPWAVWLRVSLDEAGNVVDVRVERGTPRAGTESRLMAEVRAMDFEPATEDGHPVPGELSVPVRIR